jgi:hypothetical protein
MPAQFKPYPGFSALMKALDTQNIPKHFLSAQSRGRHQLMLKVACASASYISMQYQWVCFIAGMAESFSGDGMHASYLSWEWQLWTMAPRIQCLCLKLHCHALIA